MKKKVEFLKIMKSASVQFPILPITASISPLKSPEYAGKPLQRTTVE
jgi:hypothetical protein